MPSDILCSNSIWHVLEVILNKGVNISDLCWDMPTIAMLLIASTLSGKGIVCCLDALNPRYSSSFLAKKDFSAFLKHFVLIHLVLYLVY